MMCVFISLNHCSEQFEITVSVEPEKGHLGMLLRICWKKISSDKNRKETFCETALGHVKSTRKVKLLFSLSSILTLF